MKRKLWRIEFKENGDEYVGTLYINAETLTIDETFDNVLYADNVRIEIDEPIIEAVEIINR